MNVCVSFPVLFTQIPQGQFQLLGNPKIIWSQWTQAGVGHVTRPLDMSLTRLPFPSGTKLWGNIAPHQKGISALMSSRCQELKLS